MNKRAKPLVDRSAFAGCSVVQIRKGARRDRRASPDELFRFTHGSEPWLGARKDGGEHDDLVGELAADGLDDAAGDVTVIHCRDSRRSADHR